MYAATNSLPFGYYLEEADPDILILRRAAQQSKMAEAVTLRSFYHQEGERGCNKSQELP